MIAQIVITMCSHQGTVRITPVAVTLMVVATTLNIPQTTGNRSSMSGSLQGMISMILTFTHQKNTD